MRDLELLILLESIDVSSGKENQIDGTGFEVCQLHGRIRDDVDAYLIEVRQDGARGVLAPVRRIPGDQDVVTLRPLFEYELASAHRVSGKLVSVLLNGCRRDDRPAAISQEGQDRSIWLVQGETEVGVTDRLDLRYR